MSHNRAWQISFPAISPESQRIFLNNRHGTQIPDSIIQGIVRSLSSGMAWNSNDGAMELQQKLAAFLHVDAANTFFFTESEAGIIHWLAYSWGLFRFQGGDEVIFSSQDAPMIKETFGHLRQQMARMGMSLAIKDFGYQESGEFDLKELLSLISAKTRLIFVPHIHPVFGTKNEDDIAFLKQQVGEQVFVAVDLSQSVGRIPVDLERLRCDCAFFSGRNLFSPFHFGIGYIKQCLHGNQDIFLQQELTNPLAAQTLAQGIDLLEHIGMEQVALHLQELSHYLLTRLKQVHAIEFLPGIGRCEEWCSPGYGILPLRLPGVSAEECAMLLAENALLVDLADIPQYPDAITVSLHLYNTPQDIDALVDCLQQFCV
jgi:selenocysteine lyase/cysteine desulfurase